jgi:hypothetical protein
LGIGKVGTKKWEQEKGEWVEEEVWGLLGFEANVCVQIFFVVVVEDVCVRIGRVRGSVQLVQ